MTQLTSDSISNESVWIPSCVAELSMASSGNHTGIVNLRRTRLSSLFGTSGAGMSARVLSTQNSPHMRATQNVERIKDAGSSRKLGVDAKGVKGGIASAFC